MVSLLRYFKADALATELPDFCAPAMALGGMPLPFGVSSLPVSAGLHYYAPITNAVLIYEPLSVSRVLVSYAAEISQCKASVLLASVEVFFSLPGLQCCFDTSIEHYQFLSLTLPLLYTARKRTLG